MENAHLSLDSLWNFMKAPASSQTFLTANVKKLEFSIELEGPSPGRDADRVSCYLSLHVVALAKYLPSMAELHTFSLNVLPQEITMLSKRAWTQALETVISSFPKSLTSLTIDYPSELLVPRKYSPTPEYEGPHICSLLLNQDHLPSLRHLRIRTRTMCPLIFERLASQPHLGLRTLVINLSSQTPQQTVPHRATHCTKKDSTFLTFYEEMIDAAKAAKSYLPSATTLRIIHHKLPSFDLVSHDVLSDRSVIMPEGIAWKDTDWDDDGYTDVDVQDQSDVDLFDGSGSESDASSVSNEAPFVDLQVVAALSKKR
jgi:hypothetical protein